MSDKRDLYPELPIGPLATKRDAETQYGVLEFLTQRPAAEQWAHAMEVFEAIRETEPRTDFGRVYVNLERLARAEYLEVKIGEPDPKRPGERGRKYYQATSNGTRAYNNTKTVSRSLSLSRHQKPAPAFG